MNWPTAIALVCRFYGFDLDKVMAMTVIQFSGMIEQIPKILKMETGDEKGEQEKPLSGAAGFQAIKRIIPRGTGRR